MGRLSSYRATQAVQSQPAPPVQAELIADRLLSCEVSYHVFYSRFGPMPKIIIQYRIWLRRQPKPKALNAPRDQQQNFFSDLPDAPTADVRWLRQAWQKMKVGFELQSSDFQGRPAHLCDLLVVLHHNWPACPVRVLQLSDILPQHMDVQPERSDRSFSPY